MKRFTKILILAMVLLIFNLSYCTDASAAKLPDGNYESDFVPKSVAKNDPYAKKLGNIYKLTIKGNKLTMYGSFSKNGKIYSSKKRTVTISSSFAKSENGKSMISTIKNKVVKNSFFSFTIKGGKVTMMTFAG